MIKSMWMRQAGNMQCLRKKRNVCRVLVAKAEGKRPVGRHRHEWENYIEMACREVGWGGMYWIDLAQDRE
jgi:hypothetical protein